MELNNPSQILWCNVCDKTQHEVTYLVASDRINICSECVAWCNGLIEDRKMKELFQMPAANDPGYWQVKYLYREGMSMFARPHRLLLRCALCKKREHHVRYLICGGDINICSECITKLNQKIQEQRLVRLRRKFVEDLQQPTSSDNIH